ncbi:MAG: hypothetical protein Q6352_003935 [Candidatus Freyrarchaeum guaymaensis]
MPTHAFWCPSPKRGGLDGARDAWLLIAAPARITLRTSRLTETPATAAQITTIR